MVSKKSTKKALLSSVICLILCVSMLVGTTFAWFTDSVSSGTNNIVAGNLDVEVYYGDPEDKNSIQDVKTLFNDVTLWEPGAVAYENITVVNEGTLALKYALSINFDNENTVNGYGLSQVLKIAVVKDGFDESLTREQVLEKVEEDGDAEWQLLSAWAVNDYLQKQGDTHTYGVVIWWEPSADDNNWNVNNGKTTSDGEKYLHIDLGINLVATQKDAESDSFGSDYDEKASVVVGEDGLTLAQAIAQVEDGGIVFIEPGTYVLKSGPIVIENKNVTIIGLGDVTLNKNYGGTHIFTVKNGANVTIENVTMDGQGNTREGIYVRWNSVVTLKDVVIKNTGGKDIMIDEASDAAHGEETASYVWMINSHIEDVAMCASPVTSVAATQDTYVYFNYDATSTVGSIDIQSINKKPENIIINGVASTEVGKTMQLYVTNDAELTAALETIKSNSEYWDKQVYVYMAAGEYSGDYVINQYPQWNGVVGAGTTANNYASGVPAGAPGTVITFVGANTNTRSAASATVFTGNVTVKGFGNAGAGFASAVAVTTFQNITFDAANSADNAEDSVVMYVKAAANNVNFDGCTFKNATHVTLGGSAADAVGTVNVDGCTFNDGGCLSGYVETLTVSNTTVTAAKNGFINKSKAGSVTVENCNINAGRYFIRTSNSGVELTVEDSTISVYESEGTSYLVNFRGSNESAEFIDCTIADGWTAAGVDANSTLEIYNYSETEDGLTLVTDGITDEVTLYLVPADYAGDTVEVPEGVTTIGNYAFAYNSNVKEVVLASTVRDLGRGFDSSSVEKVILNEGLTTISSRAFKATTNLKEVVFSSTVTEIADDAFQKTGLTTITIPASVKRVGSQAFGASQIETVTFEGNTTIENKAFRGCAALRTVNMNGDDITFVNTTGQANCWFCNSESNNPGTSTITFNVKNPVVAAKVKTAMGADITTITINCEATVDEETGFWVDDEGNTCAYASDNTTLSNAISGGADTVYLSDGSYTLPSVSNGDVTISGTADTVITVNKPNCTGSDVTFEGVTIKGSGYATGVQHVNTVTYNNVTINGEMCLYGEKVVFNNCTFELASGQYIWTYGAKVVEFNKCVFNTAGKAILIYNEGAGASDVTVKGCTFNATAGAKAGAIANQNCAAIEIDNFQKSGTGTAHKLTTEGNTYSSNFSGEWRIKNFVAGNAVTVNGTKYTQIAIDGKLMTIDADKNVTVSE